MLRPEGAYHVVRLFVLVKDFGKGDTTGALFRA